MVGRYLSRATLNFIEEKLDYNTRKESVSDGGVDTPRTAIEFAALPNWHADLWQRLKGQSEKNAALPNAGTDDPHPDTAIINQDVSSGLNKLVGLRLTWLSSASLSLMTCIRLPRMQTKQVSFVLCALIRSGGFVAVRVRGGDIDDQPEWGESLFISNFICFVALIFVLLNQAPLALD